MDQQPDDVPYHLSRCGDGGVAPLCVVCRHLLEGTATEWVPVLAESGQEAGNDWLCPACYKEHYLGGSAVDEAVADLVLLCSRCVDELREVQGACCRKGGSSHGH